MVSIRHQFCPFSPVTLSQIWPLLFISIIIILIQDISPLTWTEWPPSGSFYFNSWTFPGCSSQFIQESLTTCIHGNSQSPSPAPCPSPFPTSLSLPTCTSWLASHFLWMKTIKMRTLPYKVFSLAVYPQVKCVACSRCSIDKHVKWMNNGGIEIDVPVKVGDINQKQS